MLIDWFFYGSSTVLSYLKSKFGLLEVDCSTRRVPSIPCKDTKGDEVNSRGPRDVWWVTSGDKGGYDVQSKEDGCHHATAVRLTGKNTRPHQFQRETTISPADPSVNSTSKKQFYDCTLIVVAYIL